MKAGSVRLAEFRRRRKSCLREKLASDAAVDAIDVAVQNDAVRTQLDPPRTAVLIA